MKEKHKESLSNIKEGKLYSLREAINFLPWINTEPTFKKLVMEDISNNDNKKYKTIALMRNKRRRYYIKGENLVELVKSYENTKDDK